MVRSVVKDDAQSSSTQPINIISDMTSDSTWPDASNNNDNNSNHSYDEGDPNISRPHDVTASESTTTMNGHAVARVAPVDLTLLPNGQRSLCDISLHGFLLGIALGLCMPLALYLAHQGYRIWRLPAFLVTLSLFHFLEFYTTARWNTANAKVGSYLLFSNGASYNLAHASAMLEMAVTSVLFPGWQARWTGGYTVALGFVLVAVGQVVRSVAMAQAGKSFNHIPQKQKREDHVLVTSGVYAWSRHPSYFGYYWFAVGTQVLVGNKICGLIYALVLWRFFSTRIPGEFSPFCPPFFLLFFSFRFKSFPLFDGTDSPLAADEEKYLIEFFGDDYKQYKARVGTGLPFIR